MPPPVFREYLKNGSVQPHKIWGTCAQLKSTPCVQVLISQVKRSGHQVRSKSDVHSGTGFKLEDRTVGTVLVRMFSTNFQDEVLEWIPTECLFRIFHLSDLRSGQFSTRLIISMGNLMPVTYEPKVKDESNEYLSVNLVSNLESNDTNLANFDLI